MERAVAVEKKRRRRDGATGLRELTPEELSARKTSLFVERERQLVLAALAARGEAVDEAISALDLRSRYSFAEWQDLLVEGRIATDSV